MRQGERGEERGGGRGEIAQGAIYILSRLRHTCNIVCTTGFIHEMITAKRRLTFSSILKRHLASRSGAIGREIRDLTLNRTRVRHFADVRDPKRDPGILRERLRSRCPSPTTLA